MTWEMAPPGHVWDPDSGKLLHTLPHNQRVESVAFHPIQPAIMATVGRDNVVYVWDLQTGKTLARLQHPIGTSRVQFSPGGSELITVCGDGMLRIWDWREGKLKDRPVQHSDNLVDFAFTADRGWLVTLDVYGLQVTAWRTKSPAGPHWPLEGHRPGPVRSDGGQAGDHRRIFRLPGRLRPRGPGGACGRCCRGLVATGGAGGWTPHPGRRAGGAADQQRMGGTVDSPASCDEIGLNFWPVLLPRSVYLCREQMAAVNQDTGEPTGTLQQ